MKKGLFIKGYIHILNTLKIEYREKGNKESYKEYKKHLHSLLPANILKDYFIN